MISSIIEESGGTTGRTIRLSRGEKLTEIEDECNGNITNDPLFYNEVQFGNRIRIGAIINMKNSLSGNSTKAMEILNRMFTAEMEFMRSEGNDISGITAAFHPDIVVHEPASLPYPGDWRGYEELGKLFKTMHRTWSRMNVENMVATQDGDTLFMGGTLVATARQSEKEVRMPFAQILKLKDDLVIEAFPFYFDTALINAAIGHSVK